MVSASLLFGNVCVLVLQTFDTIGVFCFPATIWKYICLFCVLVFPIFDWWEKQNHQDCKCFVFWHLSTKTVLTHCRKYVIIAQFTSMLVPTNLSSQLQSPIWLWQRADLCLTLMENIRNSSIKPDLIYKGLSMSAQRALLCSVRKYLES